MWAELLLLVATESHVGPWKLDEKTCFAYQRIEAGIIGVSMGIHDEKTYILFLALKDGKIINPVTLDFSKGEKYWSDSDPEFPNSFMHPLTDALWEDLTKGGNAWLEGEKGWMELLQFTTRDIKEAMEMTDDCWVKTGDKPATP